jgi:parallel beta-helix repeat protein
MAISSILGRKAGGACLGLPSTSGMRKGAFLSALLLASSLIAIAVALAPASAMAATNGCDLVAAPNGSDSAPGTAAAPLRTVQKLADSLSAGQTGCLRAGTFSEDVTIRHGGSAGAPLVVRSYPGETATILGRLRVAKGADYTTISDLKLVGIEHGHECSRLCASPTVDANHTTWTHDDVTNNHVDTICFLLGDSNGVWGTADDTLIQDDRIHDCGALPATNYDHGIYAEETHGSQIIDNLIYGNADRGVQLYPQAIDTLVRGNVIYGNGEGVDFGADGQESSNGNVVEDNIISDSNVLYNVLSAYGPGDRVGSGNVVRHNCIGGGAYDNHGNPGGVRFDHTGFSLQQNVLAKPTFVDPAHGNFALASNSACAGILPSDALAGSEPVASPRHTRAHRASADVKIRGRWATIAGHKAVRVNGHLSSAGSHGCQTTRKVSVRVLRHGHWTTVSTARTGANCQFVAAARVGQAKRVRVKVLVTGVGPSNVVTVQAHGKA